MELLGGILTSAMLLAWNILIFIFGVAFTIGLYCLIATILGFMWKIIHKPSYYYFSNKCKKLFKRKKKSSQ